MVLKCVNKGQGKSYVCPPRNHQTLAGLGAETVSFAPERSADLVALDETLSALDKLDARKCKAVELRYFAGLSMAEIAKSLDVSPVTVRSDLRMAEAWLYHEMRNG